MSYSAPNLLYQTTAQQLFGPGSNQDLHVTTRNEVLAHRENKLRRAAAFSGPNGDQTPAHYQMVGANFAQRAQMAVSDSINGGAPGGRWIRGVDTSTDSLHRVRQGNTRSYHTHPRSSRPILHDMGGGDPAHLNGQTLRHPFALPGGYGGR